MATILRPKHLRSDLVAVLFGWAGAADKHLEKYAQLYYERGIECVRYTAPFQSGFGSLQNSRDVTSIAEKLGNIPQNRPIFLHVFSMNGAISLCALELQHPQLKVFERSVGILMDSAPVGLQPSGYKNVSQVLDHAHSNLLTGSMSDYVKYKIWKSFTLSGFVTSTFVVSAYRTLGCDTTKYSTYDFLIAKKEMPQNIGLIYSDTDTMCPPKTIIEFGKIMLKSGRNVKELHLTDSPHVMHIQKYRTEYEKLLDDLLGACVPRAKL